MANELSGVRLAILAADMVERVEPESALTSRQRPTTPGHSTALFARARRRREPAN